MKYPAAGDLIEFNFDYNGQNVKLVAYISSAQISRREQRFKPDTSNTFSNVTSSLYEDVPVEWTFELSFPGDGKGYNLFWHLFCMWRIQNTGTIEPYVRAYRSNYVNNVSIYTISINMEWYNKNQAIKPFIRFHLQS